MPQWGNFFTGILDYSYITNHTMGGSILNSTNPISYPTLDSINLSQQTQQENAIQASYTIGTGSTIYYNGNQAQNSFQHNLNYFFDTCPIKKRVIKNYPKEII